MVLVAAAAGLMAAAACSSEGGAAPTATAPSGGDVSLVYLPAPIDEVSIDFPISGSEEAELRIVSALPNSCYTLSDRDLSREGDTFRVELVNRQEVGDIACAEIYKNLETTFPLGSDIQPCKIYTVVANGQPHSVQAIHPAVKCAQGPDATLTPEGSSAAAQQGAAALCTAAPLGVSVGDRWTLAGPIRIEGPFPGQLPPDAAQWAVTYTVLAIQDRDWPVRAPTEDDPEPDTVFVEDSFVILQSDLVIADAAGQIISAEEEELPGIAVSIASLSPVLTLDWECHGDIWFGLNVTGQVEGGPETRYSVQQGNVVQFAQSVSISAPEQGIEQVSNLVFGYDRVTGRLVLVQTVSQGTANGEPFIVEMVQQLLPDDFAGPADVGRTADSQRGEIPDGIADLIERLEAEPVADPPASVTQYTFRGETVYYVPPRCCDVYGTLYNRDGLLVGHPEGGFTGEGDGRLPDFFDGRSDPNVVWEDSRTRGPDLVQVLAPIDRLEIQAAATEPPQYRVLVDSVLPDSCASFDGFSVDQVGETIRIQIFNVRSADLDVECDQVASRVSVEIVLGAGFETGVVYTIDVNGTVRTFTAQ